MSDKPTKSKYAFEERWAPKLQDFGHVQVSNYFLEHYHHLHPVALTYEEAIFIIHLMQFKWTAVAPFPAYRTLAERMHVSVKTTRRLAKSLQDKKYLVREFRENQTNVFKLDKLMAALVDCAEHPEKFKPPAPLKRRKKP